MKVLKLFHGIGIKRNRSTTHTSVTKYVRFKIETCELLFLRKNNERTDCRNGNVLSLFTVVEVRLRNRVIYCKKRKTERGIRKQSINMHFVMVDKGFLQEVIKTMCM